MTNKDKMKTFLLWGFLLCFACRPAFAGSDDGFYTRFDAGYANVEGGYNDGAVLRSGFGTRIGDAFRAEFMISRRRFEMRGLREIDRHVGETKGRISELAVTGNAYWDFYRGNAFSLYVGGGAGIGRNKMSNANIGGAFLKGRNKYAFVWHAGGGVAFELPENLTLDIGYDYVDAGYFETKASLRSFSPAMFWDTRRESVASHEFHIGLRYNF